MPYALINSVSSGENGCPTSKGKVYPSPKHEAIKESKNQKPLPVNEKIGIDDTLVADLKKYKLWQNENKMRYGEGYYNSKYLIVRPDGQET
ncbi:hypothetical protein G4D61_14690 [Bacillus ginsengihumi]|uniref:Uncharacterized protein n=1 Tax=Heyndrickxia ginsengihumi TaxID=363870 RepID=A0A6M0P8Y3_9BACI|nr:hypothetical protein [Heyndrickxia ginsengihumi]NEY21192.1 hypothetical protein [Heyndrickxia ginsengihumi]